MLRNKIGKPTQTTTSNNQTNKVAQTKATNIVSTGMKLPGGFGTNPTGTATGIKTPSLITAAKPFVKPPTVVTLPTSQKQINTNAQKQSLNKIEKPQPIRPQQIKTEQQRLAELVNKRAAQMKKQYQMINKISSQVGSEKKGYFKEYQTSYGHVLNILNQSQKKKKNQPQPQNTHSKCESERSKINKKQIIFFKVNAWDEQNLLKQYLVDNFKKQKYL